MSRLIVFVVALVLVASEPTLVGAQEATPLAGPDAGVACTVEPRPTDELLALWFGPTGTPPAAPSPAPPVASEAELPAGELADAATVVAVTATLRASAACFEANQVARAFALLTDDLIRRFGPPGETREQARTLLESQLSATPVPVTARTEVPPLREARVLADGRVGAMVTGGGLTTFVLFERRGDRWLIDAFVGVESTGATPIANPPAATPVAGSAVVSPGQPAYGKTPGEWAAAWFRWLVDHPTAGEECAAGQAGPVWFLPATTIAAGVTTFACEIPAHRAILIPGPAAANLSADECEATVDRPIPMADGGEIPGGVVGVTITVDGQPIPGLDCHRIAPAPVPGTEGWVACGYFLVLAPLPPGEHTIRETIEADGRVVVDLIYRLTVVPPGQA